MAEKQSELFPKSLHEVMFETLKDTEGFKKSMGVYLCSRGIPTIGYGTALIVQGSTWDVLDRLGDRLTNSGVQLDVDKFKEDLIALKNIAEARNKSKPAEAATLFHKHTFSFTVDEDQAKKLMEIGLEKGILPTLKRSLDGELKLGKKVKQTGVKGTYDKLVAGPENQFAALADAAYNGPGLIHQELVGYIARAERQHAFYYIGYKMRAKNPQKLSQNPGWVTRSYKEAYMYGYTDGEKPTENEIKGLEQVYKDNKAEIDAYDKEHGKQLKNAIPGWQPFSELIKTAKQGKIIKWAPPAKHKNGIKTPGISPEQISIMREYLLPQSLPQALGVSAYDQIMLRYSGAGSDAPMKNVNDPYRNILQRYGDD